MLALWPMLAISPYRKPCLRIMRVVKVLGRLKEHIVNKTKLCNLVPFNLPSHNPIVLHHASRAAVGSLLEPAI